MSTPVGTNAPGGGPGWFRRHKVLTAIGIFLVLGMLGSLDEGDDSTSSTSANGSDSANSSGAAETTPAPKENAPAPTTRSRSPRTKSPAPSAAGSTSPSANATASSQPSPSPPPTPSRTTPPGVPAGAQLATVDRIVDGDTLDVRAKRPGRVLRAKAPVTVRLLEVDTPETVAPGEPVQCFGPAATRFVTDLVGPGTEVYVLPDVERTDRYGRVLLYLWTRTGDRAVFVNRQLVITGHARAALYEPNDRYIDVMRKAETQARNAGRGLWGACDAFGDPLNEPAPEPTQPETAEPEPSGGGGAGGKCDPNYAGACIPPFPPDINCTDIDAQGFQVVGEDVHGFDADDDGIGCDLP